MSDSLRPYGSWPARLLCPWYSPGKNTGVGCHFLIQGDLPDPGIKPRSPALQADSTDWAMREAPRHLISCFLYIIATFLHSNLMNNIVNSILHMRNKGSEILTSASGWAEISSNSNAQAAFLGHVPFEESFFFPFGKKYVSFIFLRWKAIYCISQ